MKKWTSITAEELSTLRLAGAAWALGYLAILKLQSDWGGSMHTSVRELARLFDLSDFRAVKRVLNALAGAGIIALEQGPKGTFIKFLSLPENGRAREKEKPVGQSPTYFEKNSARECNKRGLTDLSRNCVFKEEGISGEGGAPHIRQTQKHNYGQIREFDSRENPAACRLNPVGESSAPALSQPQQPVEQNATPAPFPSYSPIPTNETNIDKRQEKHMYIKAAQAAQEKKSSPQKEKLRAFADKVALKFESFENQAQKNVWFYRNYKNLRDILAYSGSEQMGLLTIQACAEMLEAKGYSGGYGAVCRNLPLYYEKAKRMRSHVME